MQSMKNVTFRRKSHGTLTLHDPNEKRGLDKVTLEELRGDYAALRDEHVEQQNSSARNPGRFEGRKPLSTQWAEIYAGRAYNTTIARHELEIPESVLGMSHEIDAGKEDEIKFSSAHIQDPELKILYWKEVERLMREREEPELDDDLSLDESEDYSANGCDFRLQDYYTMLGDMYKDGADLVSSLKDKYRTYGKYDARILLRFFFKALGGIPDKCLMSDEEYVYRFAPLSEEKPITHYIPSYCSIRDGFEIIMRKEGF
jgi:hypothetical protein